MLEVRTPGLFGGMTKSSNNGDLEEGVVTRPEAGEADGD